MAMTATQILRNFLVRDPQFGFNFSEAEKEAKMISSCLDEKEYIRISRKGLTVALNRAKRRNAWLLWENAQKHAAFGAWFDEQREQRRNAHR